MKAIAIRNSLLLLMGVCMHVLLVVAGEAPRSLFGAADQLTPPGAIGLVTYAVLVLMIYTLPALRGSRPGMVARAAAALLPMPLYLLYFPMDWAPCLVGICTCLLVGHYLLLAHPEHSERPETYPFEQAEDAIPAGGIDLLILAGIGAAVIALLISGHGMGQNPIALTAAWLQVLIAAAISLPLEHKAFAYTLRKGPYVEPVLLAVAVICVIVPAWRPAALPVAALRQAAAAARLWNRQRGIQKLWRDLTERPAALLVLSFAAAIGIGTLLISLPAASAGPDGLNAVDSLFTATSAICVTGLIVVDTATDLTPMGQTFLLAMIQVGGLGIMTISMFLAIVLGRRVGLRSEFAIGEMIGEERSRVVVRLLRFIVFITLAIETAGMLVLTAAFRTTGMNWTRSLCFGTFHSISAFCNAGFALISDSFLQYARIPVFPLTLSALIVLGGLGFGVLFTLLNAVRPGPTHPGPHVRLVLTTTGVLALGGAVLFWALERNGVLADMPLHDSFINAWFQSVTTRTAGFNTVDMARLQPATDLLVRIFMFIGAAPGSTGGGVKVTTAVILLLLVRSVLLGRNHVVVLGRRIEPNTVINAAALVCMSLVVLLAATIVLLTTQDLPPRQLVFEAVSAFGTVGLSQGATPHLTAEGKLVIIVLMFIGRVGPLSLLAMMRPTTQPTLDFPSAKVMIG